MKKIVKPLISVVAIGALCLSLNMEKDAYANDIATECKYDATTKGNPDFATMNCLLTETAKKYNVPPEIVKGVAEGESGNWRHFDANGQAIVTADNGIGVMQITNQAKYNPDDLKSDIAYNIKAGVETLDEMFDRNDIPSIKGGGRDVLENWYFAVMAYNGTKPVNSPIVQVTGERNTKAYQERIFRIIKEKQLIDLTVPKFKREDFQYDTNSKENIQFLTMDFDLASAGRKSTHLFETNQKVTTTTNAKLRPSPTTEGTETAILSKGETVIVTGPLEYDAGVTKKNQFIWYPVKRSDGTKGYVASGYLDYATSTPTTPAPPTQGESNYAKEFADFSATAWWSADMVWAIERGLISGYGGVWNAKTKKYETQLQPNTQLTEAHFLTIFFRFAQKDELAGVQNTSAWKNSGLYSMAKKYNMPVLANEEAKAPADQGIKRGKMAQLMASYHFEKAVSEKEAIQFFMDNGITKATTSSGYNPNQTLTRAEISAFIQRYEAFVSKQK